MEANTCSATRSFTGTPEIKQQHLITQRTKNMTTVQQVFNGFEHNPESYAKAVESRTLLFYGSKDPKVCDEETTAIFEAIQGPKKRIDLPEAAHEDYLKKYREEWTAAVQSFLP